MRRDLHSPKRHFWLETHSSCQSQVSAGSLRPNLLDNPTLPSGERTLSRWFDTGAFAAPAQFTFGNSPRSGLQGDGLQTIDLTLSKEFPVTERFKLDVRSEFYNR